MRTGNLLSFCLVLAAAGGWLVLNWHIREDGRDDEIEYQGQHFKMSKAYHDYSDYKNDPNNIDPAENARVEQAVTNARIASTFPTADEMSSAVSELQFPGYGMSSFGEQPQPNGTALEGFSIEIPRADKDRVLVFRRDNGSYTLIDDFVTPSEAGIGQVREQAGRLVYCSIDGKPLLSRPHSLK
jgi:hypothetical protein